MRIPLELTQVELTLAKNELVQYISAVAQTSEEVSGPYSRVNYVPEHVSA